MQAYGQIRSQFYKMIIISCDRAPGTFYILLGACEPLTAPDNGMIECDFGDDGLATKGDSCIFTCDDGFEGGTTRKCWPWWGRMRWVGHEAVCKEGTVYNSEAIGVALVLDNVHKIM